MKLVAAAIIFNRDGKILIAKRKKGEKLEGYWEFPGGKLEDGETPQQCIEREISEELGVSAIGKEILGESTYNYHDSMIKLIGVKTHLKSFDFRLKVHEEVRWVPLHEILNYKLAPADIYLLKNFQSLYPRITVSP